MQPSAVVVVMLLLGVATRAAAQQPSASPSVSTFAPAAHVRVRTTSMSIPSRGVVLSSDDPALTMVGIVQSIDAAAVTVVPSDGDAVIIPMASVTTVDVSAGRKRNWMWGLLVGAGIGLAGGLTAPVDPENCGPTTEYVCSRSQAVVGFTLVVGGVGAGIGALIKSERWVRRFSR